MRRISIQNNMWRFLSDGKEINREDKTTLNVVIVGAAKHISRIYYTGTYDENNYRKPDCYSIDGVRPHESSDKIQADTCVMCSQNIKGSGAGNSRACKFQQRIAVVLESDIGGHIYQLNIPSKSIFGQGTVKKWPLQTYSKKIAENGAPITSVVTEMCLNLDDYGTRITFQPVRILEDKEFDEALKQADSALVKKAINVSFKTSLDESDLDITNKNNFSNLVHVMGMSPDI